MRSGPRDGFAGAACGYVLPDVSPFEAPYGAFYFWLRILPSWST